MSKSKRPTDRQRLNWLEKRVFCKKVWLGENRIDMELYPVRDEEIGALVSERASSSIRRLIDAALAAKKEGRRP